LVAAIGIIKNPWHGRGWVEDLSPEVKAIGPELGQILTKMVLDVTGDANDYVGKGLSGATIQLRPPNDALFTGGDNTIIGNTCLYGATGGRLFAAGQAGVRFAVRNSGAEAVVEGCGANGCEYMTGGRIAVLGPVGDNFGAGMTGGLAWIGDPEKRFHNVANPDAIDWHRLTDLPEKHSHPFELLVRQHAERTGSARAIQLLENWAETLQQTVLVIPKEIRQRVMDEVEAQKTG